LPPHWDFRFGSAARFAYRPMGGDAERLDIHNGLLLSALWDAAFDRALVTFDDEGRPEFSAGLSEAARAELRWRTPIALTDEHRERLAHHRDRARLLS
jgi:predicted restriction endonuclease